MKSLSIGVLISVYLIVGRSTAGLAGTAAVAPDGVTTWQAGVDGIEIRWNTDGSVYGIHSKYSQPVEFGDRRGISTAQVIAEEKAKGAVVRFMEQASSSTRLVTEVEEDLNKMTQERQGGAKGNVSKVDQRTLLTSLTEVTGSFAAGKLKGVVILEKGYDEKSEQAWVVAGISERTIAAARGVHDMLNKPAGSPGVPSGEIKTQPSEVRKAPEGTF